MQNLGKLILAGVVLAFFAMSARAQTDNQTNAMVLGWRMSAARSMYYMPGTDGLNSFRCNVIIDWDALFSRIAGRAVPESLPLLRYVNGVRMTTTDDLKGDGSLEWTDTVPPPANQATEAGRIRAALIQAFHGFYQLWNQFMNGVLVRAQDSMTTLSALSGGGLLMHGKTSTEAFDETYDRTMLLMSSRVVTKDIDSTLYPTFEESHEGWRVTDIHVISHQLPNSPAEDYSVRIAYSPVGDFQLPSTLRLSAVGIGYFDITLSNCTINPASKKP
jgi:hypothetical protein